MESITAHFGADHDRLDTLFSEFQSLKRKDPVAAKEKFKGFLRGLTRHIVWEEEVLFPLFEERTGMKDSGPTAVMRQDHCRIMAHLDAIHDKVRIADPESDDSEKALLQILGEHNMKEERILYPAIDTGLDPAGLESVRKAMEAVPAKSFSCCGGAHSH